MPAKVSAPSSDTGTHHLSPKVPAETRASTSALDKTPRVPLVRLTRADKVGTVDEALDRLAKYYTGLRDTPGGKELGQYVRRGLASRERVYTELTGRPVPDDVRVWSVGRIVVGDHASVFARLDALCVRVRRPVRRRLVQRL